VATRHTPVGQLDVETVVKASQALSSEIVLSKLIEKLMCIAVEHAGAERGLLILLRGEKLQLAAETTTGQGRVEVNVRQAAVTPSDLSQSVLHYVIRTRERLVLDDASVTNLCSEDEYVRTKRARSVLCLPVVKQTKLIGVLYLENNLSPRAFTLDRVRVLELLASQAAISLDNAKLYSDLQRSEAFLAQGQSISHTGSFGWIVSSGEIYWSEETYKIFDYDQSDKPVLELILQRIHPDDRDLVQQTVDRAYEARADLDFEHRLLMPDGSVKYIHVLARALETSSGDLEYVGAVTDVTAAKRVEETLRESEAYLAEAQRLSQTGSWAWAPTTGKFRYFSEECYRVTGFDPRGGLPRFETLFERVHPDDQPRISKILERATRERVGFEWDERFVYPGGEVRDLHVIGHPVLSSSGDVVEFVGTLMDVTEAKQAGEALRRSESYLAEAQRLTQTGSWAWAPATGEMRYFSDEAYRVLGVDPQGGQPRFETLFERIHPDDKPGIAETLERATRERVEFEVDHRFVLPGGEIREIHTVGHPVLSPSGDFVEFVGTIMDVTERKRADEERERLRQVQDDLAHLSRIATMGELTASLAHEIRQPIAAAVTDARTCLRWLGRDQPEVAEAREAAARTVKDATRAADIIGRISTLFKKGVPQRELVDVNEIIREMFVLLRSEANRYSISIRTELAADLPKVVADPVQLQQVFMNLMLNGIDAMKGTIHRGELTIKSEAGDSQLLISVSDTGAGFPPEQADQIFRAFVTTKANGTGMGLPISRSIIESHGGRLWAASTTGRGATFHFTLPATHAAHA
jgi:PAS domain S-box-containing protein